MLKILEARPVAFGDKLVFTEDYREISDNIIQKGNVYCIKNCFYAVAIDELREKTFHHFSALPQKQKNYGGEPLNENYHMIERGVSPYQKTLHYLHSYVFDNMNELSIDLKSPVMGLFRSLTGLYNELTFDNRPMIGYHADGKKFHSQFLQYPVGGGMFGAHTHPLEPLKLSLIVGLSKRGRDFQEGAAGFEAADGSIIDTGNIHDIGDMLIFRVNVKHWVTPCDLMQPLDDTKSSGRWSAILGVY